jgi:hypothetical protein
MKSGMGPIERLYKMVATTSDEIIKSIKTDILF